MGVLAVGGNPVSVMTVEDSVSFRAALVQFLMSEADCEVVGEAGSCAEALACAPSHEPDIILLDVNLPDGSGVDLIGPLRDRWPRARIVVLTMFELPAKWRLVLKDQVCGIVSKAQLDSDLVPAMRSAMQRPAP